MKGLWLENNQLELRKDIPVWLCSIRDETKGIYSSALHYSKIPQNPCM